MLDFSRIRLPIPSLKFFHDHSDLFKGQVNAVTRNHSSLPWPIMHVDYSLYRQRLQCSILGCFQPHIFWLSHEGICAVFPPNMRLLFYMLEIYLFLVERINCGVHKSRRQAAKFMLTVPLQVAEVAPSPPEHCKLRCSCEFISVS